MKKFSEYLNEDHTSSDPDGAVENGQRIEFKKGQKYAEIIKVTDNEVEVEYDETGKREIFDRDEFEDMADKDFYFVGEEEEEDDDEDDDMDDEDDEEE